MERPKHFADGAKQGAAAALLGVGSGLASLVVLPAKGAKQGGLRGAAVGAVQGVGAFVGLSALGVGAGLVQATRGALATPEAVKARITGKEWDKRTHRWIIYNLPEEAELVLSMTEATYVEYIVSEGKSVAHTDEDTSSSQKTNGYAGASATSGGAEGSGTQKKTVKETALYDVLGVAPDASSSQIKKAYYKMAKQCHPDKNPDDEKAKERFQEISNAYQVLSDDDLRARYDRSGKTGLEDEPKMDAKAFYTMMFGSEDFEPLVGKMDVLTMMGVDDDENVATPEGMDPDTFASSRAALARWKREVSCAMNLVDLLQPHVSGTMDDTAFRAKLEVLGSELSSSAVGGVLLGCIGYSYKQEATRQLGDYNVSGGISERLKGAKATAEHKVHTVKNYAAVASAGIAAASSAHAAEEEKEKGDESSLEAHNKQALAATKMVEVMMHTTTIEIESLLRRVCKKVTHDTSVEKDVRRKRALALKITGEVFVEISKKSGAMDSALEELLQKLGGSM